MDQAITLQRYGHEVDILTCEKFYPDKSELPQNWDISIKPTFPYAKLTDYGKKAEMTQEHELFSDMIADKLLELAPDYDFFFTHDWIFTGWNLPYAQALLKVRQQTINNRFLHWIHSVPSGARDWWTLDAYGENHRLVYPNKTDRLYVSQQFRTRETKVVPIPHIKDLRTFCDFEQATCEFLHEFPEVINSQIVQIYPASTDRLTAKRLKEVIMIFAFLKAKGHSVCLVVANQHATGRQRKEDLDHYKKIARRNGLEIGSDVIFTSDWKTPEYEKGVPRKMLSELMMLGNLFIFPTREESFGLVLPEAVLMGGCLPVLNRSLEQQFEVGGLRGLYIPFGSWNNQFVPSNENEWFSTIADLILARMLEDDCIQARTHFRINQNQDTIYQRYYEPIMAGAQLWT